MSEESNDDGRLLERTQSCRLQLFSPSREEMAEGIVALLDTHVSMSTVVDEDGLTRAIREGTDNLVHVARKFSSSSSSTFSVPLELRPVFAKTKRMQKDNEEEEEEEYGLSGVVSQLDIFLRWVTTTEETVNLVMQRHARTQEPVQVTVRTTTLRHELKAIRLHLHQVQLHVTKVSSAPLVNSGGGDGDDVGASPFNENEYSEEEELFDSAIFHAVGAAQHQEDNNLNQRADLFLGETVVLLDEQQQQQETQSRNGESADVLAQVVPATVAAEGRGGGEDAPLPPSAEEVPTDIPTVTATAADSDVNDDNNIVDAQIVAFFRPTDEGWDFDYVGNGGDGTTTEPFASELLSAPPTTLIAEGYEDVPRAMTQSVQQLLESEILPKLELQLGGVLLTSTLTTDNGDIFRLNVLGALYQTWLSKLQLSHQGRTVDMTTGMLLGRHNSTPEASQPSSQDEERTNDAATMNEAATARNHKSNSKEKLSPLIHLNKLTVLIKSPSSSSLEGGTNDDAPEPANKRILLLEGTDISLKEGHVYFQDLHIDGQNSLGQPFSLSFSGVWCTLPPTSKSHCNRRLREDGHLFECNIHQIHKLEMDLGPNVKIAADPQLHDEKSTTSLHYDGCRWSVQCPEIVFRVNTTKNDPSLPFGFLADVCNVAVRMKFRQLTVLVFSDAGELSTTPGDKEETEADRFNFFRLDVECKAQRDQHHPITILVRRLDVLDYNGWLQWKEMVLRFKVRRASSGIALDNVRLVVPSTRLVANKQSRAWFDRLETALAKDDNGSHMWQAIPMEFARLYTPSFVLCDYLSFSETISLRQEFVGDGLTTLGEVGRRYLQWIRPAMRSLQDRQATAQSDLADSAAVTVGSMALGVAISTPVGLAASVAAVGVKDAMVSAAAAGKVSRGATAQDGYQFGDVTRGAAAAVSSVTAAGKEQRGATAQDGYRFGDLTRGLSSNLSSAVGSATAAGKVSRGGSTEEGYKFGDFTRGVFSSFRKSGSAAKGTTPEQEGGEPANASKKIWNDSEKVGKLAGSSVGAAVGLGLAGPVGLLAGAYLGARAGRNVAKSVDSDKGEEDGNGCGGSDIATNPSAAGISSTTTTAAPRQEGARTCNDTEA